MTWCIKSAVLRQHHQALWQNCGIVTQHDGQTLWQNKNARLRYLRNLVLLTLQHRFSKWSPRDPGGEKIGVWGPSSDTKFKKIEIKSDEQFENMSAAKQ